MNYRPQWESKNPQGTEKEFLKHLSKDMSSILSKSDKLSFSMLFKLQYNCKDLLQNEIDELKKVLPSPFPTSNNP